MLIYARCERDGTIIESNDSAIMITCPKCGRGYFKENGQWIADRPLTIFQRSQVRPNNLVKYRGKDVELISYPYHEDDDLMYIQVRMIPGDPCSMKKMLLSKILEKL